MKSVRHAKEQKRRARQAMLDAKRRKHGHAKRQTRPSPRRDPETVQIGGGT